MPTVRITKTSVDAAQPEAKDWMLWDDRLGGFGLKVTPAGSKVYVYQYRMGGRGAKVRRFTIGKHGKLTTDGARKKAEMLALSVANGIDPQREKVREVRKAIDLAFKPYVERFYQECLLKEWAATHKYVYSLLASYAVPVIGNTPLPDITRKDIKAALAPVLDKTATASNLFAVLRRMFSWAVEQEDIDRSPIEGMKPPPLPPSRDRVLSDDELALVWRGTDELGYPFGPLVRLLILTGARREEVAAMEWSELDRTAGTWSLPACRAKNAQAAENALSGAALTVLDGLAERIGVSGRWPRKGFVFSTTGETSVSGYSRAKRRLDKIVIDLASEDEMTPPEPWRLHDLRRTLATGLQRLGVRLEVTEAVLNHISGSRSGIVGIYQRHNWKDEKRAALEAWATHVDRVLTGTEQTKVVQLSGVRA
ncbi:MAG: integrase arm-type DNA-binding domain-containing protein [Novosphingobium sp.]|uniref:tyrosine-type recombinase/integrase n=1 Tax=Novosphingobium sp. TaxID=1874826 RepID=UPI0030184A4A